VNFKLIKKQSNEVIEVKKRRGERYLEKQRTSKDRSPGKTNGQGNFERREGVNSLESREILASSNVTGSGPFIA